MWTVTAWCMLGMSDDLQGAEHHARSRLRAEVGGLGRHAPVFVGPLLNLLDRDRPEEEGRVGLPGCRASTTSATL